MGEKGVGDPLAWGTMGWGTPFWGHGLVHVSISQWVQSHGVGHEGCASGAPQHQGVLGSARWDWGYWGTAGTCVLQVCHTGAGWALAV